VSFFCPDGFERHETPNEKKDKNNPAPDHPLPSTLIKSQGVMIVWEVADGNIPHAKNVVVVKRHKTSYF